MEKKANTLKVEQEKSLEIVRLRLQEARQKVLVLQAFVRQEELREQNILGQLNVLNLLIVPEIPSKSKK